MDDFNENMVYQVITIYILRKYIINEFNKSQQFVIILLWVIVRKQNSIIINI